MNELTTMGYLDLERVAAILEALEDHYTDCTRVFFNFLRARGLTYSPEGIMAFADWLHEEHDGKRYAAQTVNNYLSSVKHRLRYVLANVHDLSEPARVTIERLIVELRKKGEKINQRGANLERCMTFEEMQAVIRYARERNPRVGLIAEFLGSTGCRISETLWVLVSDCRPARAGLVSVLVHGKGHKDRTVFIPAELYRKIRGEFGGRTYLFPHSAAQKLYNRSYVSMTLRHLSEKAIGRPISAHVFRHSYVTDQLQRFPGKLSGISRYIGHSNVSITTDIYLHGALTAPEIAEMAPRFSA